MIFSSSNTGVANSSPRLYGFSGVCRGEKGFTIIEIILAIVIIGIVTTSLITLFSGLKDIKKPEYAIQASFLALKQMESFSKKYYNTVPAAATYTCSGFSTALAALNGGVSDIDCTSTTYNFDWLVENATMTDPNTAVGSADKVKKITLTITRADGAMISMQFYTMFPLLSTD